MRGQAAAQQARERLLTYGCIFLWVFLSASVILVNKYVLAFAGFHFPVALCGLHMLVCFFLSFGIILAGVVERPRMERSTYIRSVLPIAALFAGTLWLGNGAYLYLSVSFIQMVKAIMPVTVFCTGLLLGTERYSALYAVNIAMVGVGICIAAYGEIAFHLGGFLLQAGSILTESFRLGLIQILLQSRGIKLNPITTLYYIAPACFAFLLPPFLFLEAPRMVHTTDWALPVGWLLASALCAFALNMSVFLLIGRTSALTMNIAGVLKDWLLIMLSVLLYDSAVTLTQVVGYLIAFTGVCWYNYQKLHGNNNTNNASPSAATAAAPAGSRTSSSGAAAGNELMSSAAPTSLSRNVSLSSSASQRADNDVRQPLLSPNVGVKPVLG